MVKKLFPLLLIVLSISAWVNIVTDGFSKPREISNHIQNGNALFEKELYIKALEEYSKANEIKASYETEKKIIECYQEINNSSAYVAACKRAIANYPEEVDIYVKLLNFYQSANDTKEFIVSAISYKKLFPDNEKISEYYLQACKETMLQGTGYKNIIPCVGGNYTCYWEQETYDVETEQQSTNQICSIVDIAGNNKFSFHYPEVYPSDDGQHFIVKDYNEDYFLVNGENNKLAVNKEITFEKVTGFSQGYAVCVIDGKYHYMNTDMQISNASFDYASSFSEGLAGVKQGNKWAIITQDLVHEGNYPFDEIALNSVEQICAEGRIVVKYNQKYYIMNTEGEYISENSYEYIKAFESGQPTVYGEGDKYGFVTAEGEVYIKPTFEDAKPFRNGYAPVKIAGKWGIIDLQGNIIVEPQFYDMLLVHNNGGVFIRENSESEWKILILDILYYAQN